MLDVSANSNKDVAKKQGLFRASKNPLSCLVAFKQ